jgi:hypothetical protein
VQLVHEVYGPRALSEAWDEFRCWDTERDRETPLEFTIESPLLEHFTSWLAHTWTPAMLPARLQDLSVAPAAPTQIFLARHPNLDPLLAQYLKACMDTPFSFFEILNCEAGQGFNCRDLICERQHSVVEGAASTVLRAHEILFARIVEVDGAPILDAAAPWALPEVMKPRVLVLRDEMLNHADVASVGLRRCLLAHEVDLRSFYWEFIERAFEEGSLGAHVSYSHSAQKAAGHLLMERAMGMKAAEINGLNERLLNIPEERRRIVSVLTSLYENWVHEKLAVLGDKTALEAVETPGGRLRVQALLDEIESDFERLSVALDPQVVRRMRERLGLLPKGDLH